MMPLHVVLAGRGLDVAARREVAALVQQQAGGSAPQEAELYRQLQQAARDVAEQTRAAAQDARAAAQEAAHANVRVETGTQVFTIPVPPGTPATPGVPRITKGVDGRMTIVGPDGSTTILEPDGRYTVINAKGQVTQSAHALTPEQYGIDPGAALSLSALSAFVFFFLGRWWAARRYRTRAAEKGAVATQGELGGRMERIEQAVEAVAIEVERISEGQRFTTKLLSEIRSPAPLAVGEPQR